jgi:hypothetical protein
MHNFSFVYTGAYLPHASTVEPQKPQNMRATIELQVFIAFC